MESQGHCPVTADAGIRAYRTADREQLYRICLRTGDAGTDASSLYADPRLLGHVFVGPYVELDPSLCLVAADTAGVGGYVLGTADTRAFAAECERRWWPALRSQYSGMRAAAGERDAWLLSWIRTPPSPPEFATEYPAHLHIDLLPPWQRGGWGSALLERLCARFAERGAHGVHLGVGRDNSRAVGFYQHVGFRELAGDESTIWMGRRLEPAPRFT